MPTSRLFSAHIPIWGLFTAGIQMGHVWVPFQNTVLRGSHVATYFRSTRHKQFEAERLGLTARRLKLWFLILVDIFELISRILSHDKDNCLSCWVISFSCDAETFFWTCNSSLVFVYGRETNSYYEIKDILLRMKEKTWSQKAEKSRSPRTQLFIHLRLFE